MRSPPISGCVLCRQQALPVWELKRTSHLLLVVDEGPPIENAGGVKSPLLNWRDGGLHVPDKNK